MHEIEKTGIGTFPSVGRDASDYFVIALVKENSYAMNYFLDKYLRGGYRNADQIISSYTPTCNEGYAPKIGDRKIKNPLLIFLTNRTLVSDPELVSSVLGLYRNFLADGNFLREVLIKLYVNESEISNEIISTVLSTHGAGFYNAHYPISIDNVPLIDYLSTINSGDDPRINKKLFLLEKFIEAGAYKWENGNPQKKDDFTIISENLKSHENDPAVKEIVDLMKAKKEGLPPPQAAVATPNEEAPDTETQGVTVPTAEPSRKYEVIDWKDKKKNETQPTKPAWVTPDNNVAAVASFPDFKDKAFFFVVSAGPDQRKLETDFTTKKYLKHLKTNLSQKFVPGETGASDKLIEDVRKKWQGASLGTFTQTVYWEKVRYADDNTEEFRYYAVYAIPKEKFHGQIAAIIGKLKKIKIDAQKPEESNLLQTTVVNIERFFEDDAFFENLLNPAGVPASVKRVQDGNSQVGVK
jgi:hypothetical protein